MKRLIWLACSSLLWAADLLASIRLPLGGGWELQKAALVDEDGATLSRGGFVPQGWMKATVPGTVLTSLVNQGIYPEPFFWRNNLRIPETINQHAYWYHTSFSVPSELRGGALHLDFDGINHEADVWVNGRLAGRIRGAFQHASFDITALIDEAWSCAIAVMIRPPAHPGVPFEKTLGEIGVNGGIHGRDSPAFVATIGWDWIPAIRDRDMGIWQKVYLRSTGVVSLSFPHVVTRLTLPRTDRADLQVSAELENHGDAPREVVLRGAIGAMRFEKTLTLAARSRSTALFDAASFPQLSIAKPRLWWPAGYGPQDRYELQLTVLTEGKISDQTSVRFGIRELAYVGGERGWREHAFKPRLARFVRVLCLATSGYWGFGLSEFEVYAAETGARNLARGKSVTASAADGAPAAGAVDGDPATKWLARSYAQQWITVDLGGEHDVTQVRLLWDREWARIYRVQTSRDNFAWQDAAAVTTPELQILVNGQKIFARGGNWGMDEGMKRTSRERFAAQIRLHREAGLNMIRNWVGMTDDDDFYDLCDQYGIMVWDDFWLAGPGDGPDPDDPALFLANARDKIKRVRNHPSVVLWCARNEGFAPPGIEQGLAHAIAELDGTRRFQKSSADDGAHGRGPYAYREPEFYFQIAGGFSSEIGTVSIPTIESIQAMMPSADLWPVNDTWGYHDYSAGACEAQAFGRRMAQKFGEPTGLIDFVHKAALMNYENYRAIFEAWNSRMGRDASGVLLWMSNPAQPSFVWQIYDYYLDPLPAFFGTKKANEPLHLQLNAHDNTVMAVNHGLAAAQGLTAAMEVISVEGSQVSREETRVDLPANTALPVFNLQPPLHLADVYFVKLLLSDGEGRQVSDNFYWRTLKDGDYSRLNSLPRVALRGDGSLIISGGEGVAALQIHNPASTPALAIRLKIMDAAGERILPAYYQDNYFSLLPGESRRILIRFAGPRSSSPLRVAVEGWNVAPSEIPL